MQDKKLIEFAKEARGNAYALYSNFKVGAAILTREGEVYTGCNVENPSFGLTICAERVAMAKALSEGKRDFAKIAIVSDTAEPVTPCGLCRQVLWEFSQDLEVICSNLEGKTKRYTIKELLPLAFKIEKKNKP